MNQTALHPVHFAALCCRVQTALCIGWYQQHLNRHVSEQLIRNPLEDLRQLVSKLRHHRFQHLVPVLPQEQIGRLG